MGSPLGKYAAASAAIGALSIIGGYILALVFGSQLGINSDSLRSLEHLAYLAAGALFGSAVAVNGYKAPLAAVHKRLDEAGIPPAKDESVGTNT